MIHGAEKKEVLYGEILLEKPYYNCIQVYLCALYSTVQSQWKRHMGEGNKVLLRGGQNAVRKTKYFLFIIFPQDYEAVGNPG